MSSLRKLEKRILKIHGSIRQAYDHVDDDVFDRYGSAPDRGLDFQERCTRLELEKLQAERKFLLDRRESWFPKTLWMVIVPIAVSIVASILTLYASKKLGFEIVK